jgi:L-seryl-tRNA(Ser) seleniumtransferase
MNARSIPAVEKLLLALGQSDLPRPLIVAIVRRHLTHLRSSGEVPEVEAIVNDLRSKLDQLGKARLQSVINGTGVIIHTNLGRTPLGSTAVAALCEIAHGYSNLEFDLVSGERGRRGRYVEECLSLLCAADAAAVVNNCAAALVLILRHFTKRKREVIISRGELVQIGGGFRIPEMLEASGAILREVGTTNRTTSADYAKAVGGETALILKVHRSNFVMRGFVASTATAELAQLARAKRIPLVEDLGSGAFSPVDPPEPSPAEILKSGADLVCFSGDKLFGGPQAGIIAGKSRYVAALKREPFFRALRCDKLVLAALQATIESHLHRRVEEVPVTALMNLPVHKLRERAEAILAKINDPRLEIGESKSQMGGGALPEASLRSVTINLPEEFAPALRKATPPIVSYVERGRCRIDLRTVLPEQDSLVVRALCSVSHTLQASRRLS